MAHEDHIGRVTHEKLELLALLVEFGDVVPGDGHRPVDLCDSDIGAGGLCPGRKWAQPIVIERQGLTRVHPVEVGQQGPYVRGSEHVREKCIGQVSRRDSGGQTGRTVGVY